MLERLTDRARRIDAATPPDRNRYADALRTAAIGMVVLGHWLVARIVDHGHHLEARTVLMDVPETQWLTWIFQVMPLFFFVGGMVNALSWENARKRGTDWVDWIRRRARRLLFPLIPLLVFWVAVVALAPRLDVSDLNLATASFTALMPVWFLAAYLFIVAITPPARWLHRRFGLGVVVVLVGLALVADLLLWSGIHWVAWGNFVVVWTAIHQLGFFWHDGRLPDHPARGAALAAVGVGVALWLTQFGDYPLSMVATGEIPRPETLPLSNDYPPNMALMALAVAQIGAVAALRRPLSALLERPRLWATVATTGNRMMTIFLWHMTVMVLIAWVVYATGVWPARTEIDGAWWLLRLPWLALLSIGLLAVVAVVGPLERPDSPEPIGEPSWFDRFRVAAGVALSAQGLTLLVTDGLYSLGGLSGIAWMPLVMVGFGFLALDVVRFPTFELDES